MRLNDDGKTVACFDLLVPHVGELAGDRYARSGRLSWRLLFNGKGWMKKLINGTPNYANSVADRMVDMGWVLNDLSVGWVESRMSVNVFQCLGGQGGCCYELDT